jgi:hypothetical protein
LVLSFAKPLSEFVGDAGGGADDLAATPFGNGFVADGVGVVVDEESVADGEDDVSDDFTTALSFALAASFWRESVVLASSSWATAGGFVASGADNVSKVALGTTGDMVQSRNKDGPARDRKMKWIN